MRLPGDKSIAIRALLLASVARAPWRIAGLPDGDDVAHALGVVRALGARVEPREDEGAAPLAFAIAPGPLPARVTLQVGESATLLRLTAGLLCTRPVFARLEMAEGLARRPHARFMELVRALAGEDAIAREGDALVVRGRARAGDFALETPDVSAQQKSALLLAGLALDGSVTVRQRMRTRAHTEEILAALGARVVTKDGPDGAHVVTLRGPFAPPAATIDVPGDPSSAALLAIAVAAHGAVSLEGLSVSPQRMGFFALLARMGASVTTSVAHEGACGPVADLRIEGGALTGVTQREHELAALIDEIPALACVCALASGPSRLCGLAALRGKESDRVRSTQLLLTALGVDARVDGDDLVIAGRPAAFPAHAHVNAAADHRIAMAALALGRAAGVEVTLDDDRCITKSFPRFRAALDAVRAPH